MQATLPEVVEGILSFSSTEHLSDYYEFLGALSQEERDSMEVLLGYQSLYSEYVAAEEEDFDFADDLHLYIRDPFLNSVLNEHHEVIVADTFHRFLTKSLVASGPFDEIEGLEEIRMVEGVAYIDGLRTDDYSVGMPLGGAATRSSDEVCDFHLLPLEGTNITNPDADNFYYVFISGVDKDGFEVEGCSVDITIDWGDGNVQSINNYSLFTTISHQYPAPSFNNDFGAIISVEITGATLCNSCDPNGDGISCETNTLFYTSQGIACEGGEWRNREVFDFEYNDGENRVVINQGFRFNQSSLGQPNAWGEIIHYKKKNNGNWKRAKPGKDLEVIIYGTWFLDECDGASESGSPFASKRDKEKRIICRTYRNGDDLYVRSDQELFADFNVYSNSSTIPFPTRPNISFIW